MEPRIIGGYTLHELLGRGAMSEVHAASHPVHGDRLAFKLLAEPLADDVAQTRGVDHPHVVRVIDTGRDFIVMERIAGEDLATRLARLGRLDEATARTLFAAIADGMEAVHAHDLVHRDLKPANVMLDGDAPKIVDFGIAKYLGERSAVATDRRIGSPAYMAPEQLAGGLVAPCVDVWALGVMMFEAVTGKLPFNGFSDGRCPQLFETAPRATTVSPALARLIARCLEREPGRRPPTMAAIAAELRGSVADVDERVTQDVAPPAHVPFAPAVHEHTRRWPIAIAGAAAIIATIAVVVIAWPSSSSSASAAPPAVMGVAQTPTNRTPAEQTPASEQTPAIRTPSEQTPTIRTPSEQTPATRTPSEQTSATRTPSEQTPRTSSEQTPTTRTPSEQTPATRTPSEQAPDSRTPSEQTPSTLAVEVRSTPSGATIFVNGKRRGTTPAHLELAGPASIVVKRAGYRSSRVRADHAGTLDVQLAPLSHVTHDHPHSETLD